MDEIEKYNPAEIIKIGDFVLTKEDVKRHYAKGATDAELAIHMMTANAWGLNPIKKEIMFVKYGDSPGQSVISYMVPIKRAEETGELLGYTVDYDGVGDSAMCRVTIHRRGWKEPFIHETTFKEVAYAKGKGGSKYLKSFGFQTQPIFMHKKTTINQAFKFAFPSLLGNMPYIQGEVPDGSYTTAKEIPHEIEEQQPDDDMPEEWRQEQTDVPPIKSDSPKESTNVALDTKSAGESDSSSELENKSEIPSSELTVYDVKVKCGAVGYPLRGRKPDPRGIMTRLSENKGYTCKMAMDDLDIYAIDKSRGEA